MGDKKIWAVVAALMVSFFMAGSSMAKEPAQAPASGLVETRPVLPASGFTGRVAQAYQIAAEIPQALDKLYCYCKCKENPTLKHKTLLTCYTNDHASKCEICMREAEIADEMTKQGKTDDEIHAAVDKYGEEKAKQAKDADQHLHQHQH